MQSGGVPKYVITNLKINNFKDNKSTRKRYFRIFSQMNINEHVSTKINIFRIDKGGLAPRRRRNFFLKSNKKEALPYFFLLFGRAP